MCCKIKHHIFLTFSTDFDNNCCKSEKFQTLAALKVGRFKSGAGQWPGSIPDIRIINLVFGVYFIVKFYVSIKIHKHISFSNIYTVNPSFKTKEVHFVQ